MSNTTVALAGETGAPAAAAEFGIMVLECEWLVRRKVNSLVPEVLRFGISFHLDHLLDLPHSSFVSRTDGDQNVSHLSLV